MDFSDTLHGSQVDGGKGAVEATERNQSRVDPLISVAAVDDGDIADQVGQGEEKQVWGWEGRSCMPKWVCSA